MLISKIRKYSWLVVALIALALIGFLVQDMTNSQRGVFGRNKAPEFASIYGDEVTSSDFDARKEQEMQEYLTFQNKLIQYFQGQYQMTPQERFQISEKAWTDYVNEKLIASQAEELGLTITDDEFSEIVYGPDPHPVIKNYYIGLSQTGQYDASLLPTWVDQISNTEAQQQNPQLLQEYYQFISRESVAKRDYLQTKYTDLFTKAVYVPEWMGKRNYRIMNSRTTFAFTMLPYSNIVDSTVTVTDSELKSYFNEHKNKYKQTEGRVLEYVMWEFTPTSADTASTLKALNESVEKMKASKSDSIYIATRSEDEDKLGGSFYSRVDLYAKGIDSSIVDSFFMKEPGSLVGPYTEGGYIKVGKIKSRSNMPDSVNAQHILIAINQNRDSVTAKHVIDSLMNLLNTGANFDTLAMNNSDDNGSKDAGGDLGWSTPSINFVPEFKNYLFKTGKAGETKVVKTDFGYHIIHIKEIKNRRDFENLVFLSKEIRASKETVDSLDRIATKFYNDHQTPELFTQGVIDYKLLKRPTQPLQKSMYEITGIPNSREIITWSFGADKDEFKYFTLQDRIIVAYVKEVKVNGIPDFEDVKELVEFDLIREKKGEMLTKQIADAGNGSLSDIAMKINAPVDTSMNASMGTPYAQGVGLEPLIVGTAFAMKPGSTSKPIAGNRGAYLITSVATTPAPESEDFTLNKNQLTYAWQQKFQLQTLITELKEKAKVEDNRYLFGE